MPHVAIAFTTTGESPSKGHYISELLAVRADSTGKELDRLCLHLGDGVVIVDKPTLSASFAALDEFIGSDPAVTHDGYEWRRFVRHGLADLPSERVKRFLAQSVDASEWSQRTYPRQRKDLAALLKRLGLSVDSTLSGLERDAAALARIAPHMSKAAAPKATQTQASAIEVCPPRRESKRPRPFIRRLRLVWRVMFGFA
jgi:hypothetical protein